LNKHKNSLDFQGSFYYLFFNICNLWKFTDYRSNNCCNNNFRNHIKSVGSVKLEKVINLVSELNVAIRDDDSLGYGFEIGHSYFCIRDRVTDDILRNIITFEIIPLLEEYWYDSPEKVAKWRERFERTLNSNV
jgi:hypothetical protein